MPGIDINNDGKADFSINITQIITVVTLIVSMAGSYYSLKGRIDAMEVKVEQAMQMPKQEIGTKDMEAVQREIDLKIDKVSVQASENMEEIKSVAREMRTQYKRNR